MNITARQDTIQIIVDILSTLVEEARFNFNADNLEIRVVDPSHVAMIWMEVDKSAFESWEVDDTVFGTVFGLELSKLAKLVGLVGTGDLLEISFDEDFGRININVGRIERVIRPLGTQTMQEPRIPDLVFTSFASLSGAEFALAMKAADQVGDLVTFSLDQNKFNVNVSGESDSVSVTYEAGELQELVCDNPVKSQYSLQYILPLAKRIESTVETITVRFGENHPLRLEFDIADGAGKVVYFLAPRVEDKKRKKRKKRSFLAKLFSFQSG